MVLLDMKLDVTGAPASTPLTEINKITTIASNIGQQHTNQTSIHSLIKQLMHNINNPKGLSDLPGIDIFVSTADAEKEPPLVTDNTSLSILAVDYPVDKLACYISDDWGSMVYF